MNGRIIIENIAINTKYGTLFSFIAKYLTLFHIIKAMYMYKKYNRGRFIGIQFSNNFAIAINATEYVITVVYFFSFGSPSVKNCNKTPKIAIAIKYVTNNATNTIIACCSKVTTMDSWSNNSPKKVVIDASPINGYNPIDANDLGS